MIDPLEAAAQTFLTRGRSSSLWLFREKLEISLRVHSVPGHPHTISVRNLWMPTSQRGKGVFSGWEQELREKYSHFTLRFETVVNDRLAECLLRLGYKPSYHSRSRSYILDKRTALMLAS